MKISRLLSIILGMAGFFNMSVGEDGGGAADTGPLDAQSAADAFSRLEADPDENEPNDDDSPEAAAEKLAKRELSGNDEDPAAVSDDDAETDPEVAVDDVTIEVDGKPVKLTKAELIENYKNGLRQADYTRKTMETADARKNADAETQKARQDRANYAQQLNNFAIQANGEIQQLQQGLTEELWKADPVTYLEQERTLRQRQAQSQEAQGHLQQLTEQWQAEQVQSEKAHIEDQGRMLLEKLPEWKDAAKATAESTEIKKYLGTMGYEPGEQSFRDHRQIILARKAMQYDALIERAGKAVKKIATVPVKVERSSSTEVTKPDGRTESMKRLSKSGSIEDAAAAFGAIFK